MREDKSTGQGTAGRYPALLLLTLLCLTILALPAAAAPRVPEYEESYGYVADFADVLDSETVRHVNDINQELAAACGAEIMVVTVDFLDGAEIEDYAYTLFNQWQIGSGEKNNGILLLLVIGEDNYYALQGKGLEETFSSGLLGDYLYDYLEEDFAKGDYSAGVTKVFDAMAGKVSELYSVSLAGNLREGPGEGTVSPDPAEGRRRGPGFNMMALCLVLLVILLIVFVVIARGVNRRQPPGSSVYDRRVIYRPTILGGLRRRPRPPGSVPPPRPFRPPGARPPGGMPPGGSRRSGPFSGFSGSRPGGGISRGGGAGRSRSGSFGGGSRRIGGGAGGGARRSGGGGISRGGGAGRR